MSVKIPLIEMKEDDHVVIRLKGNAESAIAIRATESAIHVAMAGPNNRNKREFLFSPEGVVDMEDTKKNKSATGDEVELQKR